MSKIIFEVVRYKNLLSSGNAWTEVRLDRSPSTLVTGRNGSGKSTMIEAIFFALFNRPFRDINKPALVNTINNKACLVEIEFRIGETHYKVVRGIKPNVFEIWINGVKRDEKADTGDDQDYLEQVILQMTHKTFSKIAVVGNATYTPFMKLTAAERRTMIDELLDISIFTKMAKALKVRADATKQTLKDLESELAVHVRKIDLQKSYIQTLHDDRAKKIKENRAAIQRSMDAVAEASAKIDKLSAERETISETIADTDKVKTNFDKLNQLRSKLRDNVASLNKEIEFFEDNDNCPTCRQNIDMAFKGEMVGTKTDKRKETETGLQKLEEQMRTLKERIDQIAVVNKQISAIDAEIREVNSTIRSENQYVAKLQQEIANEESKPSANIEAEKEKLKTMAKEAIALTQQKDEASKEKAKQDLAAVMLKDTGIKTKVISQYLPIINHLINEYLQELDFFVGFELDETFKETIRSRGRDIFAYESFSEGEKLKIDLAIMFTWITIARMKNTISTNLLIFDEVLDRGLDTESSGLVVGILSELSKDSNIFVISHYPDLYFDKMHSHLKFAKVNNYSVML